MGASGRRPADGMKTRVEFPPDGAGTRPEVVSQKAVGPNSQKSWKGDAVVQNGARSSAARLRRTRPDGGGDLLLLFLGGRRSRSSSSSADIYELVVIKFAVITRSYKTIRRCRISDVRIQLGTVGGTEAVIGRRRPAASSRTTHRDHMIT